MEGGWIFVPGSFLKVENRKRMRASWDGSAFGEPPCNSSSLKRLGINCTILALCVSHCKKFWRQFLPDSGSDIFCKSESRVIYHNSWSILDQILILANACHPCCRRSTCTNTCQLMANPQSLIHVAFTPSVWQMARRASWFWSLWREGVWLSSKILLIFDLQQRLFL